MCVCTCVCECFFSTCIDATCFCHLAPGPGHSYSQWPSENLLWSVPNFPEPSAAEQCLDYFRPRSRKRRAGKPFICCSELTWMFSQERGPRGPEAEPRSPLRCRNRNLGCCPQLLRETPLSEGISQGSSLHKHGLILPLGPCGWLDSLSSIPENQGRGMEVWGAKRTRSLPEGLLHFFNCHVICRVMLPCPHEPPTEWC